MKKFHYIELVPHIHLAAMGHILAHCHILVSQALSKSHLDPKSNYTKTEIETATYTAHAISEFKQKF